MTTQQPPSNRRLSPTEANRMTPEQVDQAVSANPAPQREMEPRNLGDVIRKADPITGIDYKQSTNAQILREAGQVLVWNLTTGYQVPVLKNLLPMKLSQYNEQGEKVFSLYQSDVPEGLPYKKTFPCMLHEDHELRPLAKKLGYPTCKTMMRSEYYVQTHAKKAHLGAFDSFNRDKIDGEKAEEREWRRTSMAAFTAAALESKPAEQLEKACVGCGESVFALNEESVDVKLNVHMRACKPYTDTFGQPEPISATMTWHETTVSSEDAKNFTSEPITPSPTDILANVINVDGTEGFQRTDITLTLESLAATDSTASSINFTELPSTLSPVVDPYSEFMQFCGSVECEYSCDGKTKAGAMNRMRAHVKREHADG